MKRFFALALALVLMFTLAACGGDKDKPAGDQQPAQSTPADNNPPATPGEGRVADAFYNMFDSGTYHMKVKIVGADMEMVMEYYFKGDMIATSIEGAGENGRMISKDGKNYIINDEEKMVMEMSAANHPDLDESAGVDTDVMEYSSSGKDDFQGKNLPYDEYSLKDGGTTQFFVDGNKLAGIRNLVDGEVIDMVILELNQNVPDKVFEIPADYTTISF